MLISSKIKPLTLSYSGRYREIWIYSIAIIIICKSAHLLSCHITLAAFSTSLSAALVSCKLCLESTQSYLSSICVCVYIWMYIYIYEYVYIHVIFIYIYMNMYIYTYSCVHIHWWSGGSKMNYYFLFTFYDHYK